MKRVKIKNETVITLNQAVEGETIEMKIERVTVNKEPIEDTAPLVYQERMSGVHPAYDIRTDRMEIALDAMTIVEKSQTAKRINFYKKDESPKGEESTGAESTQGTNDK